MVEHLIHKVNITEEAEFDIECMENASSNFNKKETKQELEFYITENKKYQFKHYFRLKDFIGETKVLYFIKKGLKFANMQIWDLVGICEEEFWDEEMEESGIIRSWIETKLNPEKEEPDWVEELRERQLLEERERKLEMEAIKRYERLYGK